MTFDLICVLSTLIEVADVLLERLHHDMIKLTKSFEDESKRCLSVMLQTEKKKKVPGRVFTLLVILLADISLPPIIMISFVKNETWKTLTPHCFINTPYPQDH